MITASVMKELSRYRVQNIDHVENTERQKKNLFPRRIDRKSRLRSVFNKIINTNEQCVKFIFGTPLRYMFKSQYLSVTAMLTFDVSGRVLKRERKIFENIIQLLITKAKFNIMVSKPSFSPAQVKEMLDNYEKRLMKFFITAVENREKG